LTRPSCYGNPYLGDDIGTEFHDDTASGLAAEGHIKVNLGKRPVDIEQRTSVRQKKEETERLAPDDGRPGVTCDPPTVKKTRRGLWRVQQAASADPGKLTGFLDP
jgi:hypothetical protein